MSPILSTFGAASVRSFGGIGALTGGQEFFSEIYRDGSSTVGKSNAIDDGGVFAKSANKLFRGTNIYNLNGNSKADPVIIRMDNNGVIDKYCSVNVSGTGVSSNLDEQTCQAILPISDDEVLQCLRVRVGNADPWYYTMNNTFAIQKVDVQNQAVDSHIVFWWQDTSNYTSVFHFSGAVRTGTDNNFFLFTIRQQSTVWNVIVKISDSGSLTWNYVFRTAGSPSVMDAGGIATDGTYLYVSHAGSSASPQGSYLSVFDGSGSSLSLISSRASTNNTTGGQNTITVDADNDLAYIVDGSNDGYVTQYDISTPSSPSVNWRRKLQYNTNKWIGRSAVPDGKGNVIIVSRYTWGSFSYGASVIWGLNGSDGTNTFINGYKTEDGWQYGRGNNMPYSSRRRSESLAVVGDAIYLPYWVRQYASNQAHNTGGSLVVPIDGSGVSSSYMNVGGAHYYNTFSTLSGYSPTNTSQTVQSLTSATLQIYTVGAGASIFKNSAENTGTDTVANFIGQSSLGSITQTRVALPGI